MKARKKKSHTKEILHRLFKNKLAVAGLVVIILLVLVAIFAPFLAPYGYEVQDLTATYQFPNGTHLLGTDNLGRDILSRLIYGTRQSLRIGVLSVALASICGITLGSIAGFYGGKTDNILMRILDIYQSVPAMLLSIALAAALGPGINNAILAIGISTMAEYARMIRAQILTIREREYVEAARAINASDARIVLKHIIPNAFAPLIVHDEYRKFNSCSGNLELYRTWRTTAASGVGRDAECGKKLYERLWISGHYTGHLHHDQCTCI